MKRALPYIAIIASMIIWSVSGIAIKHALAVLPPFTLIVMRFVPSVLLMLVIGLICRKSPLFGLQRLELRDLPLFLIAGFCQPFLYYLLETFTYDALNSPTIAETLLSTSPLLSPLFAVALLRERVTKYNIIGIIISTLGVFALTLAGSTNYSIGNYWGVLLAFAAVSAAVIDSVMMRKVPEKYSSLSFIFYAQLISLLFFLPIWFWREGPAVLSTLNPQLSTLNPQLSTLNPQLSTLNPQLSTLNPQLSTLHSPLSMALLCVAYLTVFASVIAFILFCFALRKVGVTQANAFNNIRPVFTALWMFLFFGEHLPAWKWIGMLLVIFGLFVCQRKETQ